MTTVLLVIHLLIAIALVILVLLQPSEGGGLGIGGGGAGGGGAGLQGFLGGRGTANALTRTTAVLAAGFMATSILLTIFASSGTQTDSILDQVPASEQQTPPSTGSDSGAGATDPGDSGANVPSGGDSGSGDGEPQVPVQ
ncbi:preprotein translocase subunit SecG [Rhodovibrio salinarum]|uniref:Protein-export membrane protein SecG n=1 Tax=Rhodovibrio salinarum TaxID=1087 RepID=A0A934QIU5_9PROT|nr:preprotein translocase subunit SecG [Rhodovibrio salinarum]MBK1697838.1 preprotein translocase subunit SecG [Rhodovibrio salinarum]